MITLIHLTHEARGKMGGIGAVLEGLLTSDAYQHVVDRTLLIGTAEIPLQSPPADLAHVFYETVTSCVTPKGRESRLVGAFASLEETYGLRLFYGQRAMAAPLGGRRTLFDVLLLDVHHLYAAPVNRFKHDLYRAYGIESTRYEHDWGYEEWVRAAVPALDAIRAYLGGRTDGAVLVSHEFMGLPTLLAARAEWPDLKSVYWAHEVPPVRDLLEQQADHQLLFDVALRTSDGRRTYEALLQEENTFKHALVSRAHAATRIFAVSDRIAEELKLLGPKLRETPIDVVYNGLPARSIDLADRLASRHRLLDYAEHLFAFRPDFTFTHVTRPVVSKALERDLAVLGHMEPLLAERGKRAMLLVLATDGGRRNPDLVCQMEAEYGWPVAHRVGWPDLVKGEVEFGLATQAYNESARATRAVLVNQFGFGRPDCGNRVPEGLTFVDLRRGTDVEFGQSTYEPFGISPLEVLAFGALSVITRVSGCAQFIDRITGGRLPRNVLVAEYAAAVRDGARPLAPDERRRIEDSVAAALARELVERLPGCPADFAELLDIGSRLARRMDWQTVGCEFFLPALARCLGLELRTCPTDVPALP